jgi:hypothetical protein
MTQQRLEFLAGQHTDFLFLVWWLGALCGPHVARRSRTLDPSAPQAQLPELECKRCCLTSA